LAYNSCPGSDQHSVSDFDDEDEPWNPLVIALIERRKERGKE
jgi:hypothetical protein